MRSSGICKRADFCLQKCKGLRSEQSWSILNSMKMRTNFLYRVLVSSWALSSFSEGVILPIYAVFVQHVGGDILDAGWAMGIFLITEGIFTALVHRGRYTPRMRIMLMILGWAIWLVGICSYLFISNIFTLFLAQVLAAIGNAVADPVFDLELADHTDANLKEYEWGVWEGSKAFIDGTAAIVGAFIAATFGFRILIYVMIGAATASFVSILWYVTRLRSRTPTVSSSLTSAAS